MAISTQFRLIGQFVFTWNLLEGSLNDAIVSLCRLDRVHGVIVTANLHFQTKMHIFTTMVDLLGTKQSKEWLEDALDTIANIHRINNDWRTLVVHHLTRPVDTKTVRFLKVSAKRKLHWPDIIKTKTDFMLVCGEMLKLGDAVDKIAEQLAPRSTPSALAKALAVAPTMSPPWLSLEGLLRPPIEETQRFGLATLGTPFGMLASPPPKVAGVAAKEEDKK
jgi:hypothetical protein